MQSMKDKITAQEKLTSILGEVYVNSMAYQEYILMQNAKDKSSLVHVPKKENKH